MKTPSALRATSHAVCATILSLGLLAGLAACHPPPSAPAPTATPTGQADGAAPQLHFTGSGTVTGARQTLTMGADRRAEVFRLGGALMLAGDHRPGMAFRADILGLLDRQTGLVGRSVWTDERGDQIYSELQRGDDTLIEGRITGGSGRFTGIAGHYRFRWHPLVEADDASVSGRLAGLEGWARIGPAAPAAAASASAGARP